MCPFTDLLSTNLAWREAHPRQAQAHIWPQPAPPVAGLPTPGIYSIGRQQDADRVLNRYCAATSAGAEFQDAKAWAMDVAVGSQSPGETLPVMP